MFAFLNVLLRSTMDLVAGSLTGYISEYIFSKSWDSVFSTKKDAIPDERILTEKLTRVWLQMAFSAMVAFEVRSMYTFETTEDPTGGLMFIMSMSHLMPKFWGRVQEVLQNVTAMIFQKGTLIDSAITKNQ